MTDELKWPKCGQKGCENLALYRFTWPGRDEAVCCGPHKIAALRIAETMGLHLQFIVLEPPADE